MDWLAIFIEQEMMAHKNGSYIKNGKTYGRPQLTKSVKELAEKVSSLNTDAQEGKGFLLMKNIL
ncbi:hypothetical protein [Listeria kieliensis]|uniref:Uncharacterized protein n=1 Tax=Listeria kieliensis TaxID=1621700 RepID=A0A3D8TRB4_9LIST|nr:hypothetical protein [Listeria kieliensis]RDX01217.1 hypothetical protein UR08_09780 [Listeria kieliensis]